MISLIHGATKPQNACGIEPHAAESSWRLDAPPIAALDGVEQARFAHPLDRITRTATAMRHAQNRDPTIGREILVALNERRHLGAQMRHLDAQHIDLVAHSGELRGEPILAETCCHTVAHICAHIFAPSAAKVAAARISRGSRPSASSSVAIFAFKVRIVKPLDFPQQSSLKLGGI
jgi:hypothetical protein